MVLSTRLETRCYNIIQPKYRILSKVVVSFAKFTIRIVSWGERIVSPLVQCRFCLGRNFMSHCWIFKNLVEMFTMISRHVTYKTHTCCISVILLEMLTINVSVLRTRPMALCHRSRSHLDVKGQYCVIYTLYNALTS